MQTARGYQGRDIYIFCIFLLLFFFCIFYIYIFSIFFFFMDLQTKADQWISSVVLAVNVGLLLAKGFSTWITHGSSLSIISTLLDSVVDITR